MGETLDKTQDNIIAQETKRAAEAGVITSEQATKDGIAAIEKALASGAVDREGLAVADIVDEQRNQLFRELVRTVVVGTVGYDGRHAVGVVESTDEVVAAGFGSGVGTVRVIFRGFQEKSLAVCQVMFRR